MYLRGNKWSMTQRPRRRSNPWRIILLLGLIAVAIYVNQVVVPATPPLFMSTLTPTRSPESFINEAEQFYAEGKLTQAIEAYHKAILADPNNPSLYVTLARIQVFAGEYQDAATNSQNALLKNPNNPMAQAVYGWALGFTEDNLAITMSVYAAEKTNGTQEPLLTSPLTIWDIVLGKFVAGAIFIAALVAIVGLYPAVLWI